MVPGREHARVVDESLVDDCVEILVGAFHDDPLWSWAFPDGEHRRQQHGVVWRLMVEGAIRYPWTWITEAGSATSVWIPPGGTELADEQAEGFADRLVDLLGRSAAPRALGAFAELERAHPRDTPHFYLSLLGTHPARRGHGHGLGLLADNLRAIGALGMPAYLESSNPANVPLYARHGFVPIGLVRPPGGPDVVTMWRDPVRPGPGSRD